MPSRYLVSHRSRDVYFHNFSAVSSVIGKLRAPWECEIKAPKKLSLSERILSFRLSAVEGTMIVFLGKEYLDNKHRSKQEYAAI